MTTTTSDRIEKQILLRAPLDRVWRAITDSREFGEWFGLRSDEPFREGRTVHATIVPTTVDPEVARQQKQFEGFAFEITIERIEPKRLFSYRWHPAGVDPKVDYSKEPTTLVEFVLEERADGVLLTVIESGFDAIPLPRRAEAFRANEGGWAMVVNLVRNYVELN